MTDAFELGLSPQEKAVLEEYLATRQHIIDAANRGAISTYTPQAHQLPFHQSPCTNRWFIGANRTGKTLACYAEIRWFALGEHPYRKLPGPAQLIWACCPTEELALLYHYPGIVQAIGREHIKTEQRGAHPMIVLKNGCRIVFKYYAQGAKAFPSAGVDLCFCDEEPPWPVFEEIWSRRSANRILNIVGANTMVLGLTWMFDKIVKKGLPNTDWFTAMLDDNLFIPQSERDTMKAGLKQNPVMYNIRVKGEILPVGGAMRFDANALTKMMQDIVDPSARFDLDLEHGRWVQHPLGRLSIYEMPQEGEEYIIGGDTAEGLNTSYTDTEPVWDETSMQVLKRSSMAFVADYTSGDVEPGIIGKHVLPRLHRFYNNATCNIELNLHGHTVISHARDQIESALWSPLKDVTEWAETPAKRLGTLVSEKNRTLIIDALAHAIFEQQIIVPSGHTHQQMLQFVVKANGRVEHQAGAKDDRVFAAAHAIYCHNALPPPIKRAPPTVRQQLRKIAMEQERSARRVQYFKRIG